MCTPVHLQVYVKNLFSIIIWLQFYIVSGWFEVNLDKKKLKTPNGEIFKVPSEALALAVALEWNSQDKIIKRNYMHLVSLSTLKQIIKQFC